jgi:hypothetical protein
MIEDMTLAGLDHRPGHAPRRSGFDGGPDRLRPPGVIGLMDQQTARLLSFGGGSEPSLPSRLELRTRDFLATQIDPLDLACVRVRLIKT